MFVCNAKVVIFALGICVCDIFRFPTGIGRSKCPTNFRGPEKSAQKLALRFETVTFEDPILDHFLDTFFEHFPKKWRFAPPACRLLSSKKNIKTNKNNKTSAENVTKAYNRLAALKIHKNQLNVVLFVQILNWFVCWV